MSLTSYRAAPPRVTTMIALWRLRYLRSPFYLATAVFCLHQMKGPLRAARDPLAGLYACCPKVLAFWGNDVHRTKCREDFTVIRLDESLNVRFADLAATYSPAS
jgi:hypothetical protein